mgnify:CR=1 FL=1
MPPPRPRKRTGLTPPDETAEAEAPAPSRPRTVAVNGRRRTTRSAQPVRSGGSPVGLIILLVILALVIVFVGPAAYDRATKYREQQDRQRQEAAKASQPKTEIIVLKAPAPDKSTDEPGAPTSKKKKNATSKVDASDAAEAIALIKESAEFIKKGQFREAALPLEKAKALAVSDAVTKAADEQLAGVRFYLKVERETAVSVEAQASNLFKFTLQNGNTIRAVLEKETPEELTIRKDKALTYSMQKNQVTARAAISAEQVQTEARMELDRRKETIERTPMEFYKLAVFALQNNLKPEAAHWLQSAWKSDTELEKNILEYKAGRMLREALFYQGVGNPQEARRRFAALEKDFPSTRAAQKAKEILADAQTAGIDLAATSEVQIDIKDAAATARQETDLTTLAARSEDSEGQSGTESKEDMPSLKLSKVSSTAGTVVDEAESTFIRASQLYAKAAVVDSVRDSVNMMDEARTLFGQAVDLYQKAVDKDPGNAALKKRLEEVKRKKYWSEKFTAI